MADLSSMTAADFSRLETTEFRTLVGSQEIALTLLEAAETGQGLREGGAFSLLWQGPEAPALPQGTYPLSHASIGTHDIFLVPVARTADGFQYEAVFT